MIPTYPGRYDVRAALPATLEAVEEFVRRTRTLWELREARCDDFAIELLLREVLTNAVIHGSGSNPDKRIKCVLRLRRHHFFMAVWDDGPGFDWQGASLKQSMEADLGGRGMEILHKYASRVRFNGPGNHVSVARYVPDESSMRH